MANKPTIFFTLGAVSAFVGALASFVAYTTPAQRDMWGRASHDPDAAMWTGLHALALFVIAGWGAWESKREMWTGALNAGWLALVVTFPCYLFLGVGLFGFIAAVFAGIALGMARQIDNQMQG